MRLFIAVDPDAATRERLEQTITSLRAQAPSAKWVNPAGLHLTLVFLGEVDDARVPEITGALAAVAARHRRLSLAFRGGGGFGSGRRPRVLWVGVEGDVAPLAALQSDLAGALEPLGFPREARAYSPHLTVARAREPRGDAALAACVEGLNVDFGTTTIASFVLYQSVLGPGGSKYTVMAALPLAAPSND